MSDNRIKLAFVNENGVIHPQYDPYNFLHRALELMDDAALIAERFQNKPLDQERWHRAEVRLWEGVELEAAELVFDELPWLPGARECMDMLREAGVAIVLLSRGFTLHSDKIAAAIGASEVIAHELGMDGEYLTGTITFALQEAEKGERVAEIMAAHGVEAGACIALGSTWSDAAVFERVGWSAAIHPFDERVEDAASVVIPDPDVRPVLPLLAERLGLAFPSAE